MKTVLKSGIAAAVLLLMAVPAAAQVPGIALKINPRIGIYEPLSDLAELQEAGSTIVAEQSGSLALGLGIEVDLAMMPIDFRLNLDYATGSEATVSLDGAEVGDPVDTNLLAVVADVMFRPLPNIVLVQPYLFAGGGLKQYNVGDETTADSFQSESDPTLHLGGGFDVGLGPLALNAELGDYISWYQLSEDYDTEMQHDLFVTVGFSIDML